MCEDIPGNEQLRDSLRLYFFRTNVVVVCFDVTSSESYHKTDDWLEFVRANVHGEQVFLVAGTKIDLVDERKITTEEARKHFELMDPPIPYFELSAFTGQGVNELFEAAVGIWTHLVSDTSYENENKAKETKIKLPFLLRTLVVIHNLFHRK